MESGSLPTQALPLTQPCDHCGALIDVSEQEPLSRITCPGCGKEFDVRGSVDHFELVAVAGRGGMGVVYKARDTSLQRMVALKVLRQDHSDNATLIAQLETEAAITASINHPHVVKVFSTGFDRNRFYIAMELVDKGSLDDLMRIQGNVAEIQALEVAIQIAKGLQAAHAHGLIHRDVKPGNILFANAHTAKIVDFGLAIFMDQEESVRGEIWGTPYYVAPEKLDGKPEDFRSDIYSLGATLFHAMAGRPPFEAETASLVALKHLKSEPVSLQAFAPHVSGRTAFVINRTLLKDPAARYQSYEEFIEHLEYACEELKSEAGKPKQVQRVVLETTQDQKIWGWVSMAMIVLILAGAGGIYAFRERLFSGSQEPVVEASVAEDDKSPAALGRQKWIDGKPAEAAELFRTAAKKAATPEAAAWAILQEGLAELRAGKPDAAQTAFKNLIQHAGTLSKSGAGGRKQADYFIALAGQLSGETPFDPATLGDIAKDSPHSMSFLAGGLKNWQLGRLEEAVALFRKFREHSPAGDEHWINDLKPLGAQFIEEMTRFQMTIDRFKAARTVQDREAVEKEIKDFKAPLDELARKVMTQAPAGAILEDTIPAGGYQIVNYKMGTILDVETVSKEEGARVHLWEAIPNQANQQWDVTPLENGTFKLVARHSAKALETAPDPTSAGRISVRQAGFKNKPAQKWRFESLGNGFFKIISEADGKVLGVDEKNGVDLYLGEYTGSRRKQWSFVPLK